MSTGFHPCPEKRNARGTWGTWTRLRGTFHQPARNGLMKVDRTGNGHVRPQIFESRLLQRAIGRDVERIGFAEETLEFQPLEIEERALLHAGDADALLPVLRRDDM